jgi:hypothetical protein
LVGFGVLGPGYWGVWLWGLIALAAAICGAIAAFDIALRPLTFFVTSHQSNDNRSLQSDKALTIFFLCFVESYLVCVQCVLGMIISAAAIVLGVVIAIVTLSDPIRAIIIGAILLALVVSLISISISLFHSENQTVM